MPFLTFLVAAALCYIVVMWTISLCKWVLSLFNPDNAYIKAHRLKVRNDNNYKAYLRWCEKHGEIAMNKAVFLKDVEDKEKQISLLVK